MAVAELDLLEIAADEAVVNPNRETSAGFQTLPTLKLYFSTIKQDF
jgi:hypothetical protein